MTDPRRIRMLGDVHSDIGFLTDQFADAEDKAIDAIVQLGDFGYFEHDREGATFLDEAQKLTEKHSIPLYWIDGNHENHTELRRRYFNPRSTNEDGFIHVRPAVLHAPRGLSWTWSGKRFLALGGAYSIDKSDRLYQEKKARHEQADLHRQLAKLGNVSVRETHEIFAQLSRYEDLPPEGEHFLWWPEEEIEDSDVERALLAGKVDYMITHDKPRNSYTGLAGSAIPPALPNQDKIQYVVNRARPIVLFHGHLHHRYTDLIYTLDGWETRVVGLGCNPRAQKKSRGRSGASYDIELTEVERHEG